MGHRLWVTGSQGMLAQALARCCASRGLELVGTGRELDVRDPDALLAFAREGAFSHILNCAAYTLVDEAENQVAMAQAVNATGASNLAQVAARVGAHIVHYSTDYVFDGRAVEPYPEDAECSPISVYGRTKLDGERLVLASANSNPADPRRVYVIRTSWLFGAGGRNFVTSMLRLLSERDALRVVDDQTGRPTYAADLAEATLQLLGVGTARPGQTGIYHFANSGAVTWHGFAAEIRAQALALGFPVRARHLEAVRSTEYPLRAERPAYSVLDTRRIEAHLGHAPRTWAAALAEYLKAIQAG